MYIDLLNGKLVGFRPAVKTVLEMAHPGTHGACSTGMPAVSHANQDISDQHCASCTVSSAGGLSRGWEWDRPAIIIACRLASKECTGWEVRNLIDSLGMISSTRSFPAT